MSDYVYNSNSFAPSSSSTDKGYGIIALRPTFPSKIFRLNIDDYGGKLICQKGALLCHTINADIEHSKNFTSGFFGGQRFTLQVEDFYMILYAYKATVLMFLSYFFYFSVLSLAVTTTNVPCLLLFHKICILVVNKRSRDCVP